MNTVPEPFFVKKGAQLKLSAHFPCRQATPNKFWFTLL